MHYNVYVDESGSKPKAATPPKDIHDFGVAVALIIPQVEDQDFSDSLRLKLPQPLSNESHVTDFAADIQALSRKAVYDTVREYKARIVYVATTVSGFHEMQHKMPKEMQRIIRANLTGTVKVSSSHDNPSSHVDLIAHTIMKGRAVIAGYEANHGRVPRLAHAHVLIDRIDDAILKEVRQLIDDYDTIDQPKCRKVTGFDTETRAKVEGAIVSHVKGLPPLQLPKYIITLGSKEVPGIFAADVIANAIYYYLRLSVKNTGPILLNQPEALRDFELLDCIVGFDENDSSDNLFRFRK